MKNGAVTDLPSSSSQGQRSEWARPEHMVGGPVALCFVLARSETAGVRIQRVVAFPTGFEFEVVARFAPRGDVWDPMHGLAGLCGKPGAPSGEPRTSTCASTSGFPTGQRRTTSVRRCWSRVAPDRS